MSLGIGIGLLLKQWVLGLTVSFHRSASRGVYVMSSLLVPFKKILSSECRGARGTDITNKRPSTGMAELVPLALVLAEESRRTRGL